MGSDKSHFNVSVGSDGQSHKTASTNRNLFEEKGEPKWYRTEVLLLTSLMPYCWAKPAHKFHTHHTVSYMSIYTHRHTTQYHIVPHTLHHTVTQTFTPQRVRNDNLLKNHIIISFVKLHPSYIPPPSTPCPPPPPPPSSLSKSR